MMEGYRALTLHVKKEAEGEPPTFAFVSEDGAAISLVAKTPEELMRGFYTALIMLRNAGEPPPRGPPAPPPPTKPMAAT